MFTKKKILSMLLCLAMVLGLAACGGEDKSGTKKGSQDGGGQNTSEEGGQKDTGTDAEAESGGVTLSAQSWNPNDTTIAPALAVWEELDTGVEVNYENFDYGDYIQNLKVKMAAGEGPDVFGLQDGALMEEFGEYLYDFTDLAEEKWGADWESKFNPLYLELIKGKNEGYKGLPMGGTSAGYFFTNLNALKKYGVDTAPRNYDELKAACDKIRQTGGATMVSAINQDYASIDAFMSIAGDVNQEKMYAAIAGEASWTDPELVEAFDIYQKLFTDGICVDGQMGGVDAGQYFFIEQTSPFFFEGSWTSSAMVNVDAFREAIEADAEIVVSAMDWNNDGKAAPVTTGPDIVLCINKDSKNLDAAWEFLSFMVTDGVSEMIDNNMAYLPPSTDYTLQVENFNQQAVNVFNYAMDKISDGTAGYREIPYVDLKAALVDQLQLLGLGETTPKDAATAVEAASQQQER